MSATRTEPVVVGVGRPELVLLGTVGHLPDRGGLADFRSLSVQPGGTVPTALVVLMEWGYRARLLGQISDDAFGTALRQGLAADRLDLDRLATVPGCVSPFSFVALEESERLTRTTFRTRGNIPPLGESILDDESLAGAAALLVDGTEPGAQIEAARNARARGVPVLFDAGLDPNDALLELLGLSDVLVAAERFAVDVAPHSELTDTLSDLCRMGPSTAIITLGTEGAAGLSDGRLVRQPIFADLPARDRSGAGDHFLAGVACAITHGWPLDRTLRFATAAAGLSCREIGGLGALSSLEEVLRVSERRQTIATERSPRAQPDE